MSAIRRKIAQKMWEEMYSLNVKAAFQFKPYANALAAIALDALAVEVARGVALGEYPAELLTAMHNLRSDTPSQDNTEKNQSNLINKGET